MSDDPRVGLTVTHRRYVPYSHAHYAGNLVDGAYSLGLFGDVATEVCIRTDGDEGLFASYSDVQFRAPVRAGDVLEVTAVVTRVGTRSRTLYHQRLLGIAVCIKKNGIVLTRKIGKIVIGAYGLQPDRRFAIVEGRDVL